MGDTVTVERRGHVFLMGLNRATKRNAFNITMLRELAEAYTEYEDDAQLWCAVLFAHGDHFTGGLALDEVGPMVAAGEPFFPATCVEPIDMQGRRRTKPLIVAVQGWCLTIGIELLLASDIRLAASNTRFSQMEVKRGIMPFGGATLRFPQVCGWGNAMRYLLTGETLDAQEALRIGLVQEITAPEALLDRAVELAGSVASQAPLAVQATLKAARLAIEADREAAIGGLMEETQRLMETEDAKEGVLSFVERREARFKGR